MSFAPKPYVVLYFAFQPSCPACKAAEPHLEAWRREGRYLFPVIKLNVALKDWEIGDWSPRATPSYLLTVNGQQIADYEGSMTTKELKSWVAEAMKSLEDETSEVEESDDTEDEEGEVEGE